MTECPICNSTIHPDTSTQEITCMKNTHKFICINNQGMKTPEQLNYDSLVNLKNRIKAKLEELKIESQEELERQRLFHKRLDENPNEQIPERPKTVNINHMKILLLKNLLEDHSCQHGYCPECETVFN